MNDQPNKLRRYLITSGLVALGVTVVGLNEHIPGARKALNFLGESAGIQLNPDYQRMTLNELFETNQRNELVHFGEAVQIELVPRDVHITKMRGGPLDTLEGPDPLNPYYRMRVSLWDPNDKQGRIVGAQFNAYYEMKDVKTTNREFYIESEGVIQDLIKANSPVIVNGYLGRRSLEHPHIANLKARSLEHTTQNGVTETLVLSDNTNWDRENVMGSKR